MLKTRYFICLSTLVSVIHSMQWVQAKELQSTRLFLLTQLPTLSGVHLAMFLKAAPHLYVQSHFLNVGSRSFAQVSCNTFSPILHIDKANPLHALSSLPLAVLFWSLILISSGIDLILVGYRKFLFLWRNSWRFISTPLSRKATCYSAPPACPTVARTAAGPMFIEQANRAWTHAVYHYLFIEFQTLPCHLSSMQGHAICLRPTCTRCWTELAARL